MSNDTATSWICDTCMEIIKTVNDGWVEWISYEDRDAGPKKRNLRLVHDFNSSPRRLSRHGCQFNCDAEFKRDGGIVGDMPLKDFTGSDGLMHLLSMLAENQLPQNDVIEMIKRIHIPGYEQARLHFDKAISKGAFKPNALTGIYTQYDIKKTIEFIRNNPEWKLLEGLP